MGGFSKSKTTKNKTTPSAQGKDFVNSLVNLATKTAKQPLKQYTGPRVAGFTPDQTSGMDAVRAAQGIQTPYLNTASQYAARGANPITGIPNVGTSNVTYDSIGQPQQVEYNGYTPDQFSAEGLAQFYNPYQQNVIDSTMANINRGNQLEQENLLGRAISSGSAFGGDRAGLAAAELARSQGLARNQAIAELENQGFNTALSAFQNQQGLNTQAGLTNAQNALSASGQNASNWLAAQTANQNAGLTASGQNASNTLAASQANAGNMLTAAQANQNAAARAAEQYAGLGSQAQQQALTGAGALLQTGGLQQQLEQNRIDIPYQQFQERQQYPQQQAQWLLNTLMGVPATTWGSTTTQTAPGPSAFSQIAGGLGALGSLGLGFKRGGIASYADGGSVEGPRWNPRRDPSGFMIDVYRPALDNGDGSFSTEETITFDASEVGLPPEIVTVPTIVDGRRRSEGEAMDLFARGLNPPVQRGFRSFDDAETAAIGRTNAIPNARRTQMHAPRSAGLGGYAGGGVVDYDEPVNYGIAVPMLREGAFTVAPGAAYKGEALPGYTYSDADYPPIKTKLPKGIRKAITGISSGLGYGGGSSFNESGGPGGIFWRDVMGGLTNELIKNRKQGKQKRAIGGIADGGLDFSLAPLGDIRIPQPVGIGAAAQPVEDAEVVAEIPGKRMIRIPTDRPVTASLSAPTPEATAPAVMDPATAGVEAPAGEGGSSRFAQFLDSPAGALFQGSLATLGGESPYAGVNIGNGLLAGVQAFQASQAAKAKTEGDRSPQVITREDGSVHLLYPDSGETVEVMGALPQAPGKRNTTTLGDKVIDTDSGEVVYESEAPEPDFAPADAQTLARWGVQPKPGQAWGIGEDGKPVLVYDAMAQTSDPFERERYLRNDFDKIAQNYRLLKESYAKIETGAKNPSAAGDVALIFSYMRMLDPTSTVREGEFATASNAAGVPDIVVNTYNRILTGERLTPEQRADFADTAQGLLGAQFGQFKQSAAQFRGLATEYGLNPDRVVPPEMLVEETAQPEAGATAPAGTPSIFSPEPMGAPQTFSPTTPVPSGNYRWTPEGLVPVTP